MTVYDQDPDVLRCGLHLLDVCSISIAGSCCSVTQYDPYLSSVEYVREGFVEAEQPSVEDDESIAHALQEEYVREGYVEAEPPNVKNDESIALALQEQYVREGYDEAEQPNVKNDESIALALQEKYVREGYVEAEQPNVKNDESIALALQEQYVREGYVEAEQPNVKNDESIALALQEKFSQLALEEASGASTYGNEQFQASASTQDWLAPSKGYTDAEGWENGQQLEDQKEVEIRDEVGKGYPFSSPGEKSGFDDDVDMLHLADESVLDGEVGKRLNQMVPVRHMPKINGEIPSVEDEVSDHQRLLDRLELYDLVENKVQGDGNCQFRALSDQLYRSPGHHEFVRQQIVQQLKSCPQLYDGYVPMAFGDYLKKMSKSGEWGDHVTLQAAADSYGVKIFVITSFKDTGYIEILPHIPKSKRVIFLSFWAEVHYNPIYPEGG